MSEGELCMSMGESAGAEVVVAIRVKGVEGGVRGEAEGVSGILGVLGVLGVLGELGGVGVSGVGGVWGTEGVEWGVVVLRTGVACVGEVVTMGVGEEMAVEAGAGGGAEVRAVGV